MRKLIASFFISLDGVVESPDKWHFPYFDDEMGQAVGEAIAASDTLLMGRRNYEEWAAFWPQQDPAADPFVSIMNDTRKVVASTTLETVEWQNTELIEGDLVEGVNALREGPPRRAAVARPPARRRPGGEAVSGRLAAGQARARRLERVLDRRPRPHVPAGRRLSVVVGGAPDRRVLAAARRGDEDAFRRLVEPHRPELHAHC
jgi:hypothetical protein